VVAATLGFLECRVEHWKTLDYYGLQE
jgi:hypothetical protein